MDINLILDYYHRNGVKALVSTDQLSSAIDDSISSMFSIQEISDVRSAMFFAMGRSQTLNSPCLVLVRQAFLSSCYTGIVESWFQHAKIIVLVVCEQNNDFDDIYLNRYVRNLITSDDDLGCTISEGPSIVRFFGTFNVDKINISLNQFLNAVPADYTILIRRKYIEHLNDVNRFIGLEDYNKYGMISKFVGHICGSEKKICCVLDEDWFKLDLNIFNNRYLSNRFKLIILSGQKNKQQYKKWITTNNIQLMECSMSDLFDVPSFFKSPNPSLLILNL